MFSCSILSLKFLDFLVIVQSILLRSQANIYRNSLYQRAVFSGFKRAIKRQHPGQALLHIEGCQSKKASEFYLGKTACLVRHTQKKDSKTKFKPIYGKIIASHGKSGTVRAKFASNLPGQYIGEEVRVFLY